MLRPLQASPSDEALASVRSFFDSAASMSRQQAVALSRQYRRSPRQNLHTDRDFLIAVTQGTWGPAHDTAARQIRAQARARAAVLVPWTRRASLAAALEAAALAVFSEADAGRPLSPTLCARLTGPYDRVRATTQRDKQGSAA